MEGIKYVNVIGIGPVVIEIQGVENVDLVVTVNNTLVCRTSFLAADTRLCVLILLKVYVTVVVTVHVYVHLSNKWVNLRLIIICICDWIFENRS